MNAADMKHQHSWNMAERFSEFPHTHPASSLAPRRAEQCQEALQDKKPQIEGKPHFFQQQKFTQSQGQDLRLAEGKNKRMAGKALLTTAGIRADTHCWDLIRALSEQHQAVQWQLRNILPQ